MQHVMERFDNFTFARACLRGPGCIKSERKVLSCLYSIYCTYYCVNPTQKVKAKILVHLPPSTHFREAISTVKRMAITLAAWGGGGGRMTIMGCHSMSSGLLGFDCKYYVYRFHQVIYVGSWWGTLFFIF